MVLAGALLAVFLPRGRRQSLELYEQILAESRDPKELADYDAVIMDTVSDSGLWVTFLAREPCCGARLLLNVRAARSSHDACFVVSV